MISRARTGNARNEAASHAQGHFTALIHSTYVEVVADLKRDIRIFSGSSAAMFLLLVASAFLKPGATMQLFVPCLLLVISTLACA